MTVDGVDLVLAVIGLIILLLAENMWRWSQRDKQRRQDRLRSRGLA